MIGQILAVNMDTESGSLIKITVLYDLSSDASDPAQNIKLIVGSS